MKDIKYKVITIFTILLFGILLVSSIVSSATMGMSINKSSCNVGETFTVTVSGINGKVRISGNANVSVSPSGVIFIDGKQTITCTAKSVGTGTVTVTPIDASNTSAEPEEITTSASRSIQIKEKTTTPPTNQTTQKPTTTTTKKPTTTQTKQEEPKVVEDNFYINSVILKGIKENGETENIKLSPEFNKDIYEYTCNISAQINKIEIQKEAGQYTNSIIVTGGEELKVGENIITLMLSAEDHQAKTYTIKVIKEETVEASADLIQEENTEEKQEEKAPIMISMPLWAFIALQAGIIVIEVLIILFVIKQRKGQH